MSLRPRIALLTLLTLVLVILTACGGPAPQPTAEPDPATAAPTTPPDSPEPTAESPTVDTVDDPIYLAIIWHQHQPVYFKDTETNTYVRPWVRVHATKDYVDMAAMVADYPNINVTFNLTPSLLRQIDDLANGAKDLYWVYSEVPADELTDDQKQFILDRFFDTNRRIIARFPRYQQLLELRDGGDGLATYTEQDYRDLQILFNLAWTDPDWLAEEPLASLVAKERDFSEEDKVVLFAEHLRLIQEVIPVHRDLQNSGQIEVTMTPFAHPILPLLVDTNLAQVALSDITLPADRFTYGQDATRQVELGVELYEGFFGVPPRGMWPAEGSVSQEIVSMVAQNGITWMASDEGVLANSLGFDSFTRNSNEVVVEADTLYRPYYVEGGRGGPVAIVFRDVVISDKVGFTYSGLSGDLAAQDFVDRIHAIREQLIADGAQGPHLVSVILDGENAWEYYDNDGKLFLHSLYQLLSEDPTIVTVTPTQFLEIAPEQPTIETLWAGSWISHDFSTWIGEDEENRAWSYLFDVREELQKYITGPRKDQVTPDQLEEALTYMYIAEGSDWFWWFGSDQDSGGSDPAFDQQYRDTLKQVYLALGEQPPAFLDVPIIPETAVGADRPATGLVTPTIDGRLTEGEWDSGAAYFPTGGVMQGGNDYFDQFIYGFDSQNLYLVADLVATYQATPGAAIEFYLSAPGGGAAANFTQAGSLLGFPANNLYRVDLTTGTLTRLSTVDGTVWQANPFPADVTATVGAQGDIVELAIPLALLGNADTGDRLSVKTFLAAPQSVAGVEQPVDLFRLPVSGPALAAVPDLGNTILLIDLPDPENDDYGPGTYTYATDGVFTGGSFDATNFQVGYDANNIVFRFTMRGPIENVWGSPNGLAIQTFDIYIDTDGDGVGGVALLPGRNLALAEGYTWDYAIHVEGWTPGVYTPGDDGPTQIAGVAEMQIIADPGQRKVTIRVPKSILGDNPEAWAYAAIVLGQEGFPSGGVLRVRDVNPNAEQYRFGGAPLDSTNHTRVMDFLWATPGDQEATLSAFTPVNRPQGELTADDFARIPMLEITP